jgi:coenzyme F420-0:L-glutamate ligase/coenzyme F420-1:gamma-L-glutamate ligase
MTITPLRNIPEVQAGDDLATLILEAAARSAISFRSGDIIALAQKIVSKAEGRRVALSSVLPSPRAKELAITAQKDPRVVELILRESGEILRCQPGVIIVADRRGFVMANAGIDTSNVEGDESVLLLPLDADASASRLHSVLLAATGATIGVLIVDSFGRAWRLGTIGTAIGLAGLPGLIDLRGRPDRSGRLLRSSELGAADEVAAAASLMMGQGDEGRPAVHVRGFPYTLREGSVTELLRPKAMDLFR